MATIKEAAKEFLSRKRIAVTGVSRNPTTHSANAVYQRLRQRYEVVAVNPNADEVEGDVCYPDLKSIPGPIDAVVIGTRPSHARATIEESRELGIDLVWMHRMFGAGSVDPDAARYGRANGITVIDGGCPLMFEPCSDPGHRFLRVVGSVTGKVPRSISIEGA